MSAELYDALLEAGASEEKARKAAEAVAQIAERRTDVAVIKTLVEQLQHRLTVMLTLVTCVLGACCPRCGCWRGSSKEETPVAENILEDLLRSRMAVLSVTLDKS